MENLYKQIPQVNALLEHEEIKDYFSHFYRAEIKEEIEETLNDLRSKIKQQQVNSLTQEDVLKLIVTRLEKKPIYSLRKVINGTGTIVHTNLGRSLLSKQAIKNVVNVSESYSNLEYDLTLGQRGSRYDHVEEKIARLIGSEAALVVNNNAAATLLAISAFSQGKEVIVSRGELVEIGGSFRIPEIIELSGAKLKEVGTTNRTHIKDYQQATNETTKMYLKIHPSNYHIEGFTKSVTNEDVAHLAREMNELGHDIITMEDLGSGALIDFNETLGLDEVTVKDALSSGIDIITFSGDKLLGGPQAGVIVGKKHLIEQIKSHPMCRALRVCKLTIAALEGTLRDYYHIKIAKQNIPTINMMHKSKEELKMNADHLSHHINKEVKKEISDVIEVDSTVGGGALPLSKLPSYGVRVTLDNISGQMLFEAFKDHETPVIGRIQDDQFFIDVRTLFDADYPIIVEAVKRVLGS